MSSSPVGADDPLLGQTLGHRWRLTKRIGDGTTSVVYAAKDQSTQRRVAVKVLRAHLVDDPSARARFDRERDIGLTLRHPNLVEVLDHGQLDQGRPYLILELLDGVSLTAALAGGAMAPSRAFHIAAQLARALETAHAAGIVHRDIKPDNIMLTRGDIPKLLDFGTAKAEASVPITLHGRAAGAPQYCSPEGARDEAVGPEADVYCLGIVLWQMIAGRPPFVGSAAKILEAHATALPPYLTAEVAGLPSWIDEAFDSILAKAPSDRPLPDQVATWCERAARDQEPADAQSSDVGAVPREHVPAGISRAAEFATAAAGSSRRRWTGPIVAAVIASAAFAAATGAVLGWVAWWIWRSG